ncbi:MAG TPA: thiamine pyrophosphate-dependent enzyme [Acetobacteraceae bacterium]|nr:thiamine pyrophosphate-dependent enzyme [Acetobacteraceae bacterium]
MDDTTTGAGALAHAFAQAGVRRIFGVPGGGSSLDLIEAAKAEGIEFVLARHETSAVIMAATTAELSGAPGIALCTRGPGVGNAANGMAHAALDRAPVVLVADGFSATERTFATHQYFDQAGMLAPVTKEAVQVGQREAGEAAARAIGAALAAPRGAALIELSGAAARAPARRATLRLPAEAATPDAAFLRAARAILAASRRPVAILGCEAAENGAVAAAARALVQALGCAALVTYKAKGVIPDADPHFAGIFTGGEAEAPVMAQADAFILIGADPVEFIAKPWRWTAPIVECGTAPRPLHYRAPEAGLYGPLAPMLAALAEGVNRSAWEPDAIRAERDAWRARLANPGAGAGLGPQRVAEIAQAVCRRQGFDPRVAVDAGAHMFPATTVWECERPGDLLISNGLATMGFAVPAGIAAALHDPARGALAFTGDGGLLMGMGELATAAVLGVKLVVVVFNDACLSLIDIKKGARDLPGGALGWPRADFATAMRAMGGVGLTATTEAEYEAALAQAIAAPGPALVDVAVDPSGYPAQIKALRG